MNKRFIRVLLACAVIVCGLWTIWMLNSLVKKYEANLFAKLENEHQNWLTSIESGEYDENLEHELQKILAKVQV